MSLQIAPLHAPHHALQAAFSFAFELPAEVRAMEYILPVLCNFPPLKPHTDKIAHLLTNFVVRVEATHSRPHSGSQSSSFLLLKYGAFSQYASAHRARREWRAIVFKSCDSKKSTQATLSASSHYSTIPSPKHLLYAFR